MLHEFLAGIALKPLGLSHECVRPCYVLLYIGRRPDDQGGRRAQGTATVPLRLVAIGVCIDEL